MIRESEVFKIGKFIKPHGVKGEIAFAFENDVFDRTDCPYLICRIDNIFVPFFIEEYRFKGKETALITFENIDTEEKALRFSGLDVYFPRSHYEEIDNDAEYSWDYFVGFNVVDKNNRELGIIKYIDTSTINTLFIIEKRDLEYLIPAVEEFITNIDAKDKTIYMNLPEGLIE